MCTALSQSSLPQIEAKDEGGVMRGLRKERSEALGGATGVRPTLYLLASSSAAVFICSRVGSSASIPQAQKLRLATTISWLF